MALRDFMIANHGSYAKIPLDLIAEATFDDLMYYVSYPLISVDRDHPDIDMIDDGLSGWCVIKNPEQFKNLDMLTLFLTAGHICKELRIDGKTRKVSREFFEEFREYVHNNGFYNRLGELRQVDPDPYSGVDEFIGYYLGNRRVKSARN